MKKIIFLLLFLPILVFAAINPVQEFAVARYDGGFTGWYSSLSSACSAVGSGGPIGGDGIPSYVGGDVQGGVCYYKYKSGSLSAINAPHKVRDVCPANSDAVPSGGCVCKAGFVEKNGQCVQSGDEQCVFPLKKDASGKCSCPAGSVEGKDQNGITQCTPQDDNICKSYYLINELPGGSMVQDYRLTGNIADGSTFCMPGPFDSSSKGCKVNFARSSMLDYGSGNIVTEGQFSKPTATSGFACTVGDAETPKIPKEEKCKNGYTGMVNGVEVCVNKVPNTGVNPNGTTTTTTNDGTNTTTTQTNSDTKCDKGVCTTTTTTTTTVTNNTTGTSTTNTSTGTTTENQSDYCKKNPSAKLCGGSGGGGKGDGDSGSSFTGSCKAGFQCEGDAIMCAVAREQHLNNCKLLDESKPAPEYKAAVDGTDDKSAESLKKNAAQVSVQQLDSAGLGWSRGCPTDISFDVAGKSFSLSYSKVCPILDVMANAALGLTLLSCVLWVVGKKE